ncbi:unnamed protein product [Brachionus calyciflorus]|uniref:RING-type domain-containing protein n=1 Tax=Brachionus calyciflorus TaxID=104777 RepID=A0A814HMU6_9BILA|nr:unnamed protein product [Brachionus calyciflorus]
MSANEFLETSLNTFNQELEEEKFYRASLIRDFLICPNCDQRYVTPLNMPCSHNLCNNCFKTLKNDLPPASLECPVCHTVNPIPERGFPLNALLADLLDAEPVEVKRGKSFQKLIDSTKSILNELNSLVADLNTKVISGEHTITFYCSQLREQVNYSTNKKIDQLNQNREIFLGRINDYQKKCIDNFLKSQGELKDCLDKSLFELDEWKLGLLAPDSDETDIEDIKLLAENLKHKLENEKFKFELLLYGDERLKFVEDEHDLVLDSIGRIRLEKIQSEELPKEEGYGSFNESKQFSTVPH